MRALAVFALCALAACTWPKKLSSDIDAANTPPPDGVLLPPGVTIPARERLDTEVDGLYPSTIPNDRMCCWLAPDATLTAAKPAGAKRLVVFVLVPQFAFFTNGGQSLTVTVAGRTTTFPDLPPGVHQLPIDLDPAIVAPPAATIRIGVRSSRTFVPAHEGVNADTRDLAVVLLGVSFS